MPPVPNAMCRQHIAARLLAVYAACSRLSLAALAFARLSLLLAFLVYSASLRSAAARFGGGISLFRVVQGCVAG